MKVNPYSLKPDIFQILQLLIGSFLDLTRIFIISSRNWLESLVSSICYAHHELWKQYRQLLHVFLLRSADFKASGESTFGHVAAFFQKRKKKTVSKPPPRLVNRVYHLRKTYGRC